MMRPNLPEWIITVPVGKRSREPLCSWPSSKEEEKECWKQIDGSAGTGVLTGPSGLLVLDIDVGHGDGSNGVRSLLLYLIEKGMAAAEAVREVSSVPVIGRSRRGGLHLHFRRPDGVGGTATGILPGVDTRGAGGMVVVAPTPGYQWLRNDWVHLQEPPGWLLRLLAAHTPPGRRAEAYGHNHGKRRRECDYGPPVGSDTVLQAESGEEGTARELLKCASTGSKIPVYCPVHDDARASAVIFPPTTQRGRITLWCSACGHSWRLGRLNRRRQRGTGGGSSPLLNGPHENVERTP